MSSKLFTHTHTHPYHTRSKASALHTHTTTTTNSAATRRTHTTQLTAPCGCTHTLLTAPCGGAHTPTTFTPDSIKASSGSLYATSVLSNGVSTPIRLSVRIAQQLLSSTPLNYTYQRSTYISSLDSIIASSNDHSISRELRAQRVFRVFAYMLRFPIQTRNLLSSSTRFCDITYRKIIQLYSDIRPLNISNRHFAGLCPAEIADKNV